MVKREIPSLASYLMKPSDLIDTFKSGGFEAVGDVFSEKKDSFLKGVDNQAVDQMRDMLFKSVFENAGRQLLGGKSPSKTPLEYAKETIQKNKEKIDAHNARR